VHFRLPHVAPGSQALAWALVFGIYVWLFLLGVGVGNGLAVILGALTGGASFLLVRNYGVDLARKRRERRRTSG
jgi:hypothetical protein